MGDMILNQIFGGEERFQKEFPALYKDINSQNADGRRLLGESESDMSELRWKDYRSLRLIYDPEKSILRVRARIHKQFARYYSMAKMIVENEQGIIREYHYADIQKSFLCIDEEIELKEDELKGICANVLFVGKGFFIPNPEIEEFHAETVERSGIDIVGNGTLIHPVSRFGRDKVNIIYWRDDEKGTADYRYTENQVSPMKMGIFIFFFRWQHSLSWRKDLNWQTTLR